MTFLSSLGIFYIKILYCYLQYEVKTELNFLLVTRVRIKKFGRIFFLEGSRLKPPLV